MKKNTYQPTGSVSFEQLPAFALVPAKIEPVAYQPRPGDPGLTTLLKPFVSKDALRPAMHHVFFGATDIVATDAHRIALLPHKTAKPALYDLAGLPINERYPDYPTAFPVVTPATHKDFQLEAQGLRSYLTAAIKFTRKAAEYPVALQAGPGDWIGFNAKYLLDTLTFFERLGASRLHVYISAPNRVVLFAQKPYSGLGKQPLVGLMPKLIYLGSEHHRPTYPNNDRGLELRAYWSLADNAVYGDNPRLAHVYEATRGQWTTKTSHAEPALALRTQTLLLLQRQRLRLTA